MQVLDESNSTEICCECGRSVEEGTGLYRDRTRSVGTSKEQRENLGYPFPEGNWICRDCFRDNNPPPGKMFNLAKRLVHYHGAPKDLTFLVAVAVIELLNGNITPMEEEEIRRDLSEIICKVLHEKTMKKE